MAVAFFFKGMLTDYIPDDCMKVPNDPDGEYNKEDYPHFEVFCALHLASGMEYETLEHNARIIGNIPDEQIRLVTVPILQELGCEFYSASQWD